MRLLLGEMYGKEDVWVSDVEIHIASELLIALL